MTTALIHANGSCPKGRARYWEERTEAFLFSSLRLPSLQTSVGGGGGVSVRVRMRACVRACVCVDRDTWLAAVHGVTKSRTEPLNKGPRLKKGPPQWAFEVRLSQSPPFFSCLGTTSVQEYGGGGGEADPWPRQEHRRSALRGKEASFLVHPLLPGPSGQMHMDTRVWTGDLFPTPPPPSPESKTEGPQPRKLQTRGSLAPSS